MLQHESISKLHYNNTNLLTISKKIGTGRSRLFTIEVQTKPAKTTKIIWKSPRNINDGEKKQCSAGSERKTKSSKETVSYQLLRDDDTKRNRNNLRNILLYSNANLIKAKDIDGYICRFCSTKFSEPKDLKLHSLREHEDLKLLKITKRTDRFFKIDVTDLTCKLCSLKFDKLDDFTAHLIADHQKKIYTDIKSEIIPFKFNSETLHCALCETEFTNFKILQEHMHVHFRNYVCDVCNSGYINMRSLVFHKRKHTMGDVKCDHCDKTFSSKQNKSDHEQRFHLGGLQVQKRNKCKFCEEKFKDYWTKIEHMYNAHNFPRPILNCQACDRTFSNKRALTVHVKKNHLMERNHKCDVCDMKFFYKHALSTHMTVHTGEKNVQCRICEKRYATKKSLRQHMRSHADDRRYACSLCPQAYVQESSLLSHIRTKHGD